MLVQALARYAYSNLSEELKDEAFEEKPVPYFLEVVAGREISEPCGAPDGGCARQEDNLGSTNSGGPAVAGEPQHGHASAPRRR